MTTSTNFARSDGLEITFDPHRLQSSGGPSFQCAVQSVDIHSVVVGESYDAAYTEDFVFEPDSDN